MALSYKGRRRVALLVLVVGLPIYILVASVLATTIAPDSVLVTLLLYVGLGILWILPFKSVFKGIGQEDPNATSRRFDDDP
ncbi:MAG: DUF2842 domain-containing protein [Shimia sp.]|nr:DUF2842 domain-containing protein [Shimia sp.]MCP4826283.1 DUF2842 domain-containing protein [Shimia sp.]|mmetsp:Transcript_8848/g.14785  ORF Transcript_8848/g.14785 Transcript_8848/m.14785 type:complete len:81 (-) Transcript_8848:101-343(-)|eukprot:CAMPEP_0184471372 /NCGR_PEP_ID=MMETSP0740-20130409/101079_1 /TAXON_ID=385413 /ORGANISM="Thalassiosira miniscula, Strain CCMP1093" /LENGTH=80 /DNA_ID=CAMNT_0026847773 /DNA_START=99 /DNA_END=341 /DNA_ORIENTATION=+